MLVVADIAEALSAERPYRPALPWERVIDIMGKDVDTGICGDCFAALNTYLLDTDYVPFGPSHAVPACAAT